VTALHLPDLLPRTRRCRARRNQTGKSRGLRGESGKCKGSKSGRLGGQVEQKPQVHHRPEVDYSLEVAQGNFEDHSVPSLDWSLPVRG